MKKVKFLFLGLLLFVLFPSVSLGSYLISNFSIWENSETITSNTNNICKVTFASDPSLGVNTEKTFFVEKDEKINITDSPSLIYNDKFIVWTSSLGNLSFDMKNEIIVNSDVTFTPSLKENTNITTSANGLINFNITGGVNGSTNFSGNTANFYEPNANSKTTLTNFGEFNSSVSLVNNLVMNFYFKEGSDDVISNGLNVNQDYIVNNDMYIGLDDPTKKDSNGKVVYNSNSKNYCVTRINLSTNLYLKNTEVNLGGKVGFFGSSKDYPQTNYQGYIIGQYNEIDLCGNYLVVGEGSEIWQCGSITNSKPESGGLIVKSGGVLKSHFVVEDHHHETSLPTVYTHGDAPFMMYRSPYLTTNTIFESGSQFYLCLNMHFGPSQGAVYKEMLAIGTSNDAVFNLSNSPNGYIERRFYFSEELQKYFSDNDKIAVSSLNSGEFGPKDSESSDNNICHEKITYDFYKVNTEVNLPSFEISMASVLNFNINLRKGNFFIPPYFGFNLYDSSITIFNSFIFLPGSFLNVDINSSVVFSFRGISNVPAVEYGVQDVYAAQYFQEVASLTFVVEKSDYIEARMKRIDDDDDRGGSRTNADRIFDDCPLFWMFANKNPAYCNLKGKFIFNSGSIESGRKYSIGGTINIYNLNQFKEGLNENVLLHSSFFNSTGSRQKLTFALFGIIVRDPQFNISDFYTLPVISFGKVLFEESINNIYSFDYLESNYDKETGIINFGTKSYAYFFVNQDGSEINYGCSALNRAFSSDRNSYISKYDDLTTQLFEVKYNDNTHSAQILNSQSTLNGKQFIYFHGMHIEVSSLSSATCNGNISKFRSSYCNRNGDMTNRSFTFSNENYYYGRSAWKLA